jgi:glycosyltransferase involved in cell wall biosynthesis
MLIYASEWAANGAIRHYQADPAKIRIVPWGANFECTNTIHDIRGIVDSRPKDRCKLFFFGFDWQRKRGDFALEVARRLNQSGLKTELTAATIAPTLDEPIPDFVKFITINKTTKPGLNQLFRVLSESHFLILPTLADASPYALPEACAFGLPCLTTDVGGIPTMIRDDINGRAFSVKAGVENYCSYISDLFANYSQYESLAFSTFHEYESRLNWSTAGQTVKKLLEELIS